MICNLLDKEVIVEGDAVYNSKNDILELKAESNFVLWFDYKFEQIKQIKFEFCPLSSEGLAMIFFGADGKDGKDLFSSKLEKRTGEYPQYHSSDIKCFHGSYYRRKWESERELH